MAERLRFKKTKTYVDWEDPIEEEEGSDYFSLERDRQEVAANVAADGGSSIWDDVMETWDEMEGTKALQEGADFIT